MKASNNNNLDKLISRTISQEKPKFGFDKWKEKHKKEIQIYESQTADRQIAKSVLPFNIWRIVMKSRIARVAAAVVIAGGALLGLNYLIGDGTSRAYGMSDVPKLLYTAQTIHIKGKIYFPEEKQGRKQTFVETEHWLDLETGRWRLIIPSTCSSPEGFTIKVVENICDGSEYEMSIDHTSKEASFTKISKFQRQLFNRQNVHSVMQILCNNPEMLDEYKVVGEEIIDGQVHEIWEAVFPQPDFKYNFKIRSWLLPGTGEFAKVMIWMMEKGRNWKQKMEIDSVERNIEMGDEIFGMQVPTGYKLINTKETAEQKPINPVSGCIGNYWLWIHVLFLLPDGSAILCWSSEDTKSTISQRELFTNLSIGGDFPRLPFQVDALHTHYKDEKAVFKGHHLTYTSKDDRFHEWGLYIPSNQIDPEYAQLLTYYLVYSDNVDDPEFEGKFHLGLRSNILVKDSEEFAELFTGAIEEFSDDENIPEKITYESVMQLAKKFRN